MDTTQDITEFLDGFKRDLVVLFKETEKHILSQKKEGFEVQFKLAVLNSKIDLIKRLSKEAKARSNGGWTNIKRGVHESYAEGEAELRRLQLNHPASREGFKNDLKWMTERGVKKDLPQLRKIKENPPYTSREIEQLLKIAEKHITESVEETENVQDLAWATFQRELPRLLRDAPGKWVAFHGNREAAVASSKQEVYERLSQMKCPLEEVVVRQIKAVGPPLNLQRSRRSRIQ